MTNVRNMLQMNITTSQKYDFGILVSNTRINCGQRLRSTFFVLLNNENIIFMSKIVR